MSKIFKKWIKQYAKYLNVEDYLAELEKSNQINNDLLANLKVRYYKLNDSYEIKDNENERLRFRNHELKHKYAELEKRYHELLSKIN